MKCVEIDDKTNIVCTKHTRTPSAHHDFHRGIARAPSHHLRRKLTRLMYEMEWINQFTDSINNKLENDGTIKPNDFNLTKLN